MSGDRRRAARFPLRLDELSSRVKDARPQITAAAEPVNDAAPKLRATAAAARSVLRPQRPVEHAHADAARRGAPSGLGLDSADVRKRMAQRLRGAGVTSEAVLNAMATVPRHLFVDAALVTQAYEDTSLPIGHGQTISKPSVVARMIELLLQGASARGAPAAAPLGRVLEIGTGCGYQAALLCRLASSVVSIERVRGLHDKARALTAPLRQHQLRLVYGDGMHGHAPRAPYDSIIAAASGNAIPEAWLAQLAVGGRLIAPVAAGGGAGANGAQALVVVDRHEHGCERSVHEAVQFVPLKSGSA